MISSVILAIEYLDRETRRGLSSAEFSVSSQSVRTVCFVEGEVRAAELGVRKRSGGAICSGIGMTSLVE